MKEPKTVFLECQICKHLTETLDPKQEIKADNVYGADVTISVQETQEVVFCEKCTTALWPKEYAVIAPKILDKKPKPPTKRKKVTKKAKKPLTRKTKKPIIPPSNDKNEDIEKN